MASSRRQYPFDLIEPKWQGHWNRHQLFRAWNPGEEVPAGHPFARRHQGSAEPALTKGEEGKKENQSRLTSAATRTTPPKYYILDMFPYPSGAGLHVGHPEGYTATDILARYRRALGFNVLHPMGWDAFGLQAEQYAIKTGQHPRVTTEANIENFKRQIQSLGFSYDLSREIDTTDHEYFKWTQWIFLKIYNSWFNPKTNRAEPIETLQYPEELDSGEGCPQSPSPQPSPAGRGSKDSEREERRRAWRDAHRLAYVAEAPVNWCPELGTVLANEEVIDGKSEVGGFPVVRRPMRQWMLRITAYAERLLTDLETIDWTPSLKEMQRNWIGRSEGAEVAFEITIPSPSPLPSPQGRGRTESAPGDTEPAEAPPSIGAGARQSGATNAPNESIAVFTTRPDTLFGATYMVLAPEHRLVDSLTTPEQRQAVADYRARTAAKSDLERTELARDKTGVFTGAHAINPVNGERIPIWIADYVLSTYGTGAIMAVPGHDERDLEFARKFDLPVRKVVEAPPGTESIGYVGDAGKAVNSGFLDGLPTPDAKKKIIAWLEEKRVGRRQINYKLRDWLFSRQRYWGEPFPIVWKNGHHEALPESALPVCPPELSDFKPTSSGEPPLARAVDWVNLPDGSKRETNTMPQWAGSCWYYLRFVDSTNSRAVIDAGPEKYWMGTEAGAPSKTTPGVDLYVGGTEHAVLHLLYSRFWHKVLFDLGQVSTPEPFYKLVNQGLILGEDGQKMSKARGNVVNPDSVVNEFGADSLRLYEMFMGPLEMVKPWNTKGVEGVYRFLGRVWRLFVDEKSETDFEQNVTAHPERSEEWLRQIQLHPAIQDVNATPEQLKVLHATIKKVTEDLDGMRFNTAISALMVFVNEAMGWEKKPKAVLQQFLLLLQPFAPHLAEELYNRLQKTGANNDTASPLAYEPWPKYDPAFLVESTLEIPVQINGKLRDRVIVPADASEDAIKQAALASDKIKPFLDGKTIKKVIVVPKKLVNIVAV